MLTRLKVNGFKNLRDVDVRFGPFTCIAGTNGVGKSNLFDAIRFLALLADQKLMDAAIAVRSEGERSLDVRNLFSLCGGSYAEKMRFEVEMLVPPEAVDDLGQTATAKTTFLRYTLELCFRTPANGGGINSGMLEITLEELTYIQKGDAEENLPFNPSKAWRQSAVQGACRSPLISTTKGIDGSKEHIIVKMHQDGRSGRTTLHPAANLPRTILSTSSASESPTALCARREMASWTLLQLEPSALRRASDFKAPNHLAGNGAHLAATLYHLAESANDAEAIRCQVANRLAELLGGIDKVWVDRDDKRELLTVFLRDRNQTDLPARALSDGTLRFLALAVLELDPGVQGTICLEEPENGIHPERIPAMLKLLQDIATDPRFPVGSDNPLRQVVINTHSPVVVQEIPDDCLLVAENALASTGTSSVRFSCVSNTWRAGLKDASVVAKGRLLAYLNPIAIGTDEENDDASPRKTTLTLLQPRRVADRPDLQPTLPGLGEGKP
ncbi:MAG: AAA family ATPase [Lentisphaeria bacterium]